MIPLTTRGSGADSISSLIHTLINQSAEDLGNDVSYKGWGFNDYEIESPDELMNGVGAPAGSRTTIEGAEYGTGDRYRDYSVGFTNLAKFTIELPVTEELEHWTRKKSMKNTVIGLKNWADESILSLNNDVDVAAAKMFYLGFGTTYFTGGDGLSQFNSGHLIRAGGTQSNMFSTVDGHLAFSTDALNKAISIMNRFKAPNGRQIRRARSLRILHSTELDSQVDTTINSLYGPSSNLGESLVGPGVMGRRGIKIDHRVIEHMPAAYKDYWFIVDQERAVSRFKLGFGWKPRVQFDSDLSKGIPTAALGSVYFSPSVLGFQSVFGSKGDGSSTA